MRTFLAPTATPKSANSGKFRGPLKKLQRSGVTFLTQSEESSREGAARRIEETKDEDRMNDVQQGLRRATETWDAQFLESLETFLNGYLSHNPAPSDALYVSAATAWAKRLEADRQARQGAPVLRLVR